MSVGQISSEEREHSEVVTAIAALSVGGGSEASSLAAAANSSERLRVKWRLLGFISELGAAGYHFWGTSPAATGAAVNMRRSKKG